MGAVPPDIGAAADEPPPLGIAMATPTSWFNLDLSANAMTSARKLVESLVAGQPNTDQKLKLQMIGALQAQVRKAREQGGVLAAFWSLGLEGHTMGASVIAAVAPLGPDVPRADDGSVDLDQAVAAVSSTRTASEAGNTVVGTSTIDLPVGPAIRVHKHQTAEALGSKHDTEVVQYFVVVPGGRRLVVLTFSTPSLELAEALFELFDAMAATLRWR
jgi:hypothetical protein